MFECPTVRIVNSDDPTTFIIINAADFDPARHQLFEGDGAPPAPMAVPDATLPTTASAEAEAPITPLRTDGPTFEDYVAAGYAPESYPPVGYAEVPSPDSTRTGRRRRRLRRRTSAP
jgi:hypothetical protein